MQRDGVKGPVEHPAKHFARQDNDRIKNRPCTVVVQLAKSFRIRLPRPLQRPKVLVGNAYVLRCFVRDAVVPPS